MKLTRRGFLKLSGGTIAGIAISKNTFGLLSNGETFFLDKEIVPDVWKKAVCRYCGTGCGTEIGVKDGRVVAIKGNNNYPVNKGDLCLKGLSLMYVNYSDERATKAYSKKGGVFKEISMDSALTTAADQINSTIKQYGKDSVAIYVGAQLYTEEMYLANKLFKGVIGTNNVESNARLCMASAVTGFLSTFGLDEPCGGYSDIEASDCFFFIGSNLAEQHPVIFSRVLKRKEANPNVKIIVVDPRFTPTAAHADIWLPIFPGTDVSLLNAMANILVKENYIDKNFIELHTNIVENGGPWGKENKLNFAEFSNFLSEYDVDSVSKLCGVDKNKIIEAARLFGSSNSAVSFWTMGLNQRTQGTWCNNLVYNLHLLTGKICKPGSTPLSMTGQPNACGGTREQGMLSHLLPGHKGVKNAKHREIIEDIWKVPRGSINSVPGPHTMKMFDSLGDNIKLIWIVCSNPAQTLPNLNKYLEKLDKAYVIVQDIFPPSQVQEDGKFRNVTAEYADLFIPSSFWIEKQGVFGNTERRSSLSRQIIEPPSGIMSDADIFTTVGKKMGFSDYFYYTGTESVWNEYLLATKGTDLDLSGATYDYLDKNDSAQWPIISSEEGGSALRYIYPEDKHLKRLVENGEVTLPADNIYFYGFSDGRAKIFKRPYKDAAELPDSEYPFYLTTGRVVHHWHSGTMTMRVPWLKKMVKEAFVEINIKDAKNLKIKNDEMVKLTSRRGEIVLKAKIVDTQNGKLKGVEERVSIPRPGVVFVPFFDADKLINFLSIDAIDDMSKQPEYKVSAIKIEKL